jgi:hypothetical protein
MLIVSWQNCQLVHRVFAVFTSQFPQKLWHLCQFLFIRWMTEVMGGWRDAVGFGKANTCHPTSRYIRNSPERKSFGPWMWNGKLYHTIYIYVCFIIFGYYCFPSCSRTKFTKTKARPSFLPRHMSSLLFSIFISLSKNWCVMTTVTQFARIWNLLPDCVIHVCDLNSVTQYGQL